MNFGVIEGATGVLGKPEGWDETKPPCGALPYRMDDVDGTPAMVSKWEPRPDEILALLAGAGVELWVAGTVHPPVSVQVGAVPNPPAGAPAVISPLDEIRAKLDSFSKAEIQAWEGYARGAGHDMHEHPLHYLFLDEKTNAARYGWKAALAWALNLLPEKPKS